MSVCAPDGRWVRLHGGRDPVAEADRLIAPAFADGEPPLLVVIGLGLGYVLDAIERRSAVTRVLAIEPIGDAVPHLLARRDWTAWTSGGRLVLLVGPEYRGAADAFTHLGGDVGTPVVIVHPVMGREFGPLTERARGIAETVLAGVRANEAARRKFAGLYLGNTLTNLPVIVDEGDVSRLTGQFTGVPAILVAAGPSLDHNLDGIRRLCDRALVVAVDTSLRPLLAAGVHPQFVVSVDPQEANGRHLRDLAPPDDTWLVGEGSIDPPVFDAFRGRTFVFQVSGHQPWPWLAQFGLTRGTLRAWGSVLTTAFDLAARMGCDPIVFAGADMAYSRGLLYCRHTTYERDWQHMPGDDARAASFRDHIAERATVPILDVHGQEIRTTPWFLQFRNWLVARAGEHADRLVLNATGDGILAGGPIRQVAWEMLDAERGWPALGQVQERIQKAWPADDGQTGCLAQGALRGAVADARAAADAWLAAGNNEAAVPEPLAAWFRFARAEAVEPRARLVRSLRAAAGTRDTRLALAREPGMGAADPFAGDAPSRQPLAARRRRVRLPMHLLTEPVPAFAAGDADLVRKLSLVDRRAPFELLYQSLTRLGYEIGDFAPGDCQRYVCWTARQLPAEAVDRSIVLEVAWIPRWTYQVSPAGSNDRGHYAARYQFRDLPGDEAADTRRQVARLRTLYAGSVNRDNVARLRDRLPGPFFLFAFQLASDCKLRDSGTTFTGFYTPTPDRNLELAQACVEAVDAAASPYPVIYKQHPFDSTVEFSRRVRSRAGLVLDNADGFTMHEVLATGLCRGVVSINSNSAHEAAVWDVPALCLGPLVWHAWTTRPPFPGTLADLARLPERVPSQTPEVLAYLQYLLRHQWTLSDFQNDLMVQALLESRGLREPLALRRELGV